MPLYEYECEECGARRDVRRQFSERTSPMGCPEDGRPMHPVFTPNGNIHIPVHFKAVRTGGEEGGYSWSDFHEHSEKELAQIKELNGQQVEIVPTRELMSQSGIGSKKTEAQKAAELDAPLTKAFERAATKLNTVGM